MNFAKETTAAGTSFMSISALSPNGSVMDSFHHLVLSVFPSLSQGAVDDIGKMVVTLVLTLASRLLMKMFEKKKPEPVAPNVPVPLPPQPEFLTLNKNNDGNKEESSPEGSKES